MSKATVWLIARPACYRIVASDEEIVVCKIEAGSSRVLGRVVEFARTEIQAAIDLGEMRAVRTRPNWASDTTPGAQQDKLAQEAALTTVGPAEGKHKTTVKKGKVR